MEGDEGMNFPNQTRATSKAREREDPCRRCPISAMLRPNPGLFSGPVNAFMGTVFFLGFTDRQVCVPLCQSLSLVVAGVIQYSRNGETGRGGHLGSEMRLRPGWPLVVASSAPTYPLVFSCTSQCNVATSCNIFEMNLHISTCL